MATFSSPFFSELKGSVGNITTCKRKDTNVVKSKIFGGKKKSSPAQRAQRTRMKTLSHLSMRLHRAIKAGHPGMSWSAARVAFIAENQQAVDVNEETLEATVNYQLITYSAGNLTPPRARVTVHDAERTVQAEWTRLPLSPLAKDDDLLYLVILDQNREATAVYPCGSRVNPDSPEITLPKECTPEKILAYTFALSSRNSRASLSVPAETVHE